VREEGITDSVSEQDTKVLRRESVAEAEDRVPGIRGYVHLEACGKEEWVLEEASLLVLVEACSTRSGKTEAVTVQHGAAVLVSLTDGCHTGCRPWLWQHGRIPHQGIVLGEC
jgi:hypothetical protein